MTSLLGRFSQPVSCQTFFCECPLLGFSVQIVESPLGEPVPVEEELELIRRISTEILNISAGVRNNTEQMKSNIS